ncbi:glutamate--cysteine ligase [Methylomarinum sp. Ch1-1]|uniref:Glutamate--cysteine ligase n=1 Tax=Methylomarinum roseum TaxID=3067653 RepID=A0AAU7NYG6_9GAMM|nr:glutamate--cysteine ligase [Methylomarinum sp. Ch1-1]MDP4521854.1 glutamate--cysteine ligase [Methylomarinum sp. Ch1-1]
MNKHSQQYPSRLQYILDKQQQHLLSSGLKGIEKESLRISADGMIAQTDHPAVLGSALTHPHITTDYSEALLEFITPPFADIRKSLDFLRDIHQFVYDRLDGEMLLAASMPCGIDGDESIRIAEYGASNIGKMKHIYRVGLWHRYGRTMQAIAGIHFNYSAPDALWPLLHQHSGSTLTQEAFISDAYFGLVRNFLRQGWLILYLFGASPAICKSFFKSRPHLMAQFDEFDRYTLYHPYATSLRMSDIGYKSKNQADLKIDYNSLIGYVDSLSAAIATPYPEYQKFGVRNREYHQLNANILQIENEFYSIIRPKQITDSGEKPTLALKRRGVRYVEIRSLDLDLFNPIGIDEEKSHFLEAFLLHCLLQDSPLLAEEERQINNRNQLTVAHEGRKPGVELTNVGRTIALQDWATQILHDMEPICDILDQQQPDQPYRRALAQQRTLVDNPDQTPSAKILAEMRNKRQPFGRFGLDTSAEHQRYFSDKKLAEETCRRFEELASVSHRKQREIESNNEMSFEQFLQNYFAQK